MTPTTTIAKVVAHTSPHMWQTWPGAAIIMTAIIAGAVAVVAFFKWGG